MPMCQQALACVNRPLAVEAALARIAAVGGAAETPSAGSIRPEQPHATFDPDDKVPRSCPREAEARRRQPPVGGSALQAVTALVQAELLVRREAIRRISMAHNAALRTGRLLDGDGASPGDQRAARPSAVGGSGRQRRR